MSSTKKITSFFVANSSVSSVEDKKAEAEPDKKKCRRTNPSPKTVKKWEDELKITLNTERDQDGNVCKMFCEICVEHRADQTSSFVTGCTSIKKESVKFHKESDCHKRAVDIKAAAQKKTANKPTPIQQSLMKLDEKAQDKLDKLFRTAYFIASHAKPFTDFAELCKLQNENGIDLGDTYINDKACVEFITHIAGCYFDDLKKILHDSPFLSIYCDGTTDNSNSEKECILVRAIDDFEPRNFFLKLVEPENTKADGILKAIDAAFDEFEMPDYKNKTIAMCSDGASVMMGGRNGVIQNIRETGNAPWILAIWCIAHRLELALKDCFKQEYLQTVVDVLTSIFYFYRGSSKRCKEAAEIAEVMDTHFTKPERCNGTRWVDHKLRAISKLIKNWKVLVMHMMNYAEDHSNGSEYRAKAKGILKKMMQFKFLWYIHFMKDLLGTISAVSLQFQREDLVLSSALTKVQSANESLHDLGQNDGENIQSFRNKLVGNVYEGETLHNVVDDVSLNNEKQRLVLSVTDCINVRLGNLNTDEMFVSCHVFDPKNWPDDQQGEALNIYGNGEIGILLNHFREPMLNAGVDENQVLNEWKYLKLYISRNQHFTGKNPLSIYKRISREDVDRKEFSNILLLIHLIGLYPLSNAECERCFSVMKRIKSDWRCSLSTERMDQLMRISIRDNEGFQPRRAVNRWWISGNSSKRPDVAPYGPRH
ncbi:zinc finger protein 862-like [Dreissena polymorpha]|uniref:zinc finger protein 862-like n=1 Tax=Dreissena polymorpha TaxID=45954 RepID=UPI0022643C77|nr:zinc finger protein 862-like isoform X1 [Dreissena polymorpha]XP_052223804.1 zinc finger protein 862-like isoform X2 [Dreissena polymorpha]XP_052224449.1 zinc finger protein 862-like [Dreissena polymorpha]XP_052233596.1 zinc finger protein 862-like [Dreissena polymorpha]